VHALVVERLVDARKEAARRVNDGLVEFDLSARRKDEETVVGGE
jgi:hypothetical protein